MKNPLIYPLLTLSLLFLTQVSFSGECDLPAGVSVDGSHLRGSVSVNVGGNQTAKINVFVKNKPYPDGRCAAQVFKGSAALLQTLYMDYINSGLTPTNIKRLADSISGSDISGLYIDAGLSACGYNGFLKTITCGPGTDMGQKQMMAHENMHGWEFFTFLQDTNLAIQFQKIFFHFTNSVYDAYMHDPNSLSGLNWTVFNKPNTQREVNWVYGMQSWAEWGSEVFADWMFHNSKSRGVWPYIQAHQPTFESYFNCLWKTDKGPAECANLLNVPIQFAENNPMFNPPESVDSQVMVNGNPTTVHFTKVQSQAIWNVCFANLKGNANEQDLAILNTIIKAVAPRLPDNAARYYRLGYADANHDNVLDWVCKYEGPGPNGVGNGQYLWNAENKEGTYTFIVSGKVGDPYVEYKQDPFLKLPTINGSLAQPQFREWQGQFNSAFGAESFSNHNNDWYEIFVSNTQH